MSDFVTMDRSNPNFRNLLLGNLTDRDRIAIPVKSFHVNQLSERVTFQYVEIQKLQKPQSRMILFSLFRLDHLPLVLAPALSGIAIVATNSSFDLNWLFVVLLLLSLAAIHSAVFCGNDFIDHMKGVDRLSDKSGSRVIQNGWLRAGTVQKLFWSLIAISIILAVPLFVLRPYLLILAGSAMVLGVMGYTFLKWRSMGWVLSDIAIWSCLGPLLLSGVILGLGGEVSFHILGLGSFYGILAIVFFELRHLVSSMADHEARVMTLPVRVGFDRAKIILSALMISASLIFAMVITLGWPDLRSLLGLPLVMQMVWISAKIYKVKSPLSSVLYSLQQSILHLYVLVGLFLVLSYVADYFY